MSDTDEPKQFLLRLPNRLYGRLLRYGGSARGGLTNEILRRLENSFAEPLDLFAFEEAENHCIRLGRVNTGVDKSTILGLLRFSSEFERVIFALRSNHNDDFVLTVAMFGRRRGAILIDRTQLNLDRRPRFSEVQEITSYALHSECADRLFFSSKRAPDTSKLTPTVALETIEALPLRPLTADTMPQFLRICGDHWSAADVHNFVTPIDQWIWD